MMLRWLPYLFIALMIALFPAVKPAAYQQSGQHHAAENCQPSCHEVTTAQHQQQGGSSSCDHHDEIFCFHNHSIVAVIRTLHQDQLLVGQFQQALPEYRFSATSIFLFPDFRPPIV